jgi:hypothetical protein
MRLALVMLARPLLAAGVVASVAAIGVSRLAPAPQRLRTPTAERHMLISPFGVDPGESGMLWLDAATGRTTLLPQLRRETLQHASQSPWRDESGRLQVVGRGVRPVGDADTDVVALVRLGFPDGRVIDRIAVNVVPASPPCWYPGPEVRVLFGGGDFWLHHVAFEPADGLGDQTGRCRPLTWACPTPEGAVIQLSDPHWPADPRFARTLLVTFSTRPARRGPVPVSPRRIWWVQLDTEGDTIEDAGPVFDTELLPRGMEARSPSVAVSPDGGLALAYFTSDSKRRWTLRVAPLTLDAVGRPRAACPGETLANDCRPYIPAVFSADGRWISAVQTDPSGRAAIVRLDLADRASTQSVQDEARDDPPRPAPDGKWAVIAAIVQAVLAAFHAGPSL